MISQNLFKVLFSFFTKFILGLARAFPNRLFYNKNGLCVLPSFSVLNNTIELIFKHLSGGTTIPELKWTSEIDENAEISTFFHFFLKNSKTGAFQRMHFQVMSRTLTLHSILETWNFWPQLLLATWNSWLQLLPEGAREMELGRLVSNKGPDCH